MASNFSRCFLVLSLAAIVAAQISVPVESAMNHWEQEVKYYGPESNAFQILKVFKAFAQYYDDYGFEPPRTQFDSLHYHEAWNRMRIVRTEYI